MVEMVTVTYPSAGDGDGSEDYFDDDGDDDEPTSREAPVELV